MRRVFSPCPQPLDGLIYMLKATSMSAASPGSILHHAFRSACAPASIGTLLGWNARKKLPALFHWMDRTPSVASVLTYIYRCFCMEKGSLADRSHTHKERQAFDRT